MADYDPFARGPHPVGVRTFELADPDGDRTLPVEVWYPATDAVAGQDLDDATRDHFELAPGVPPTGQDAVRDAPGLAGPATPVVFSHGFAGNRRQTTHLCTHLASHGYVVAAPDHVGNTTADVILLMMGEGGLAGLGDNAMASAAERPRDVQRTLDALLGGELGVEAAGDGAGLTGHSFGGWTTLQTTGRDTRVTSALPLAPAGGRSGPTPDGAAPPAPIDVMADLLDLDWDRRVPALMIVADEDSVLPLAGMHDLLARSDDLDRMVVIVNADHFHFCDGAEVVHDLMAPIMGGQTRTHESFVAGADAYAVTTGLGLAHFDATLRGVPEAQALLARDLVEVLAERAITIEVVTG